MAPEESEEREYRVSPAEWRQLVGAAVEERRIQRGYGNARRAAMGTTVKRPGEQFVPGISDSTWRAMESGRFPAPSDTVPTPTQRTLDAMGRVLGWRADFVERLLRGEQPIEVGDDSPRTHYERAEAQLRQAQLAITRAMRHLELLRDATSRTSPPP